jgi:hypothetical protein
MHAIGMHSTTESHPSPHLPVAQLGFAPTPLTSPWKYSQGSPLRKKTSGQNPVSPNEGLDIRVQWRSTSLVSHRRSQMHTHLWALLNTEQQLSMSSHGFLYTSEASRENFKPSNPGDFPLLVSLRSQLKSYFLGETFDLCRKHHSPSHFITSSQLMVFSGRENIWGHLAHSCAYVSWLPQWGETHPGRACQSCSLLNSWNPGHLDAERIKISATGDSSNAHVKAMHGGYATSEKSCHNDNQKGAQRRVAGPPSQTLCLPNAHWMEWRKPLWHSC